MTKKRPRTRHAVRPLRTAYLHATRNLGLTPADDCDACHVRMKRRIATRRRPYRSPFLGLYPVALTGIEVFTCPKCGAESGLIPHLSEMNREIGRLIATVQRPTAGQIRCLRTLAAIAPEPKLWKVMA